jgi:hypothetical protein
MDFQRSSNIAHLLEPGWELGQYRDFPRFRPFGDGRLRVRWYRYRLGEATRGHTTLVLC